MENSDKGFYIGIAVLIFVGFCMNAAAGKQPYSPIKIEAAPQRVYDAWGEALRNQRKETPQEREQRLRTERDTRYYRIGY